MLRSGDINVERATLLVVATLGVLVAFADGSLELNATVSEVPNSNGRQWTLQMLVTFTARDNKTKDSDPPSALQRSTTVEITRHEEVTHSSTPYALPTVDYGDEGYYRVYKSPAYGSDAMQTCVKDGANLAIINSAEEESVIIALIMGNFGRYEAIFFGLHSVSSEGNPHTNTGEPQGSYGYIRWDNEKGKDVLFHENCSNFSLTHAPWNLCSATLPFICEMHSKW